MDGMINVLNESLFKNILYQQNVFIKMDKNNVDLTIPDAEQRKQFKEEKEKEEEEKEKEKKEEEKKKKKDSNKVGTNVYDALLGEDSDSDTEGGGEEERREREKKIRRTKKRKKKRARKTKKH